MAKITSTPQAFPISDIFSTETTQTADLGAKAYGSNGDVYRYCLVGATALVAGKLYDGPAEIGNHQNLNVGATGSAGDTTITVTLGGTAATANQYAGGSIVIIDEAGQGYTYGIESHPAQSTTTGDLVITLVKGETVQEALVLDTSQASLIPNQYNGIIVHAASETGVPVGVAIDDHGLGTYGYIKTGGVAGILQDSSAGAVGKSVGASTTTEGAVTANDGTLKEIGTMLETGTSTEYNAVMMTLDT